MGSLGLSGIMFCCLMSRNSSQTTTVVMLKPGLSGESWLASHAPDQVCVQIIIIVVIVMLSLL